MRTALAFLSLALLGSGCSGGSGDGPRVGDGDYLEYATDADDSLRMTFSDSGDGLRVSPEKGPPVPVDPALRLADGSPLSPADVRDAAPDAPLWLPPDRRRVGAPVWDLGSRYATGLKSPKVKIVGSEEVDGRPALKAEYVHKAGSALKSFTVRAFYEVESGFLLRYERLRSGGRGKSFALVDTNVVGLK